MTSYVYVVENTAVERPTAYVGKANNQQSYVKEQGRRCRDASELQNIDRTSAGRTRNQLNNLINMATL